MSPPRIPLNYRCSPNPAPHQDALLGGVLLCNCLTSIVLIALMILAIWLCNWVPGAGSMALGLALANPIMPDQVVVRFPEMYPKQRLFWDWNERYPNAQALVCPAGTKAGKSFGSAAWLLKEALVNPGSYCVWLAPTYLKCRIGYRYIKAMLPDCEWIEPVDGRLEIRFANGSFIQFLHGRDAETTVEGENIDRAVIDEAGKISKQVWYSLYTTLTQTEGLVIVTGTPRGYTWYYDIFRKAKQGDPFFCWGHLQTADSPYVSDKAVEQAKRLLPKHLFEQYYLALFLSESEVFGDLSKIWDEALEVPAGVTRFWIHPDPKARQMDVYHGVDIAKRKDYTVFYSVNGLGQLVGYCRFRKLPYPRQAERFAQYIKRYFQIVRDAKGEPISDNLVWYDATGVGDAFGDLLAELDIDATIEAVTFNNKIKSQMVTRTNIAIEQGWHSAPRIEQIEHEFASFEVNSTKSGLFQYSAPDGEHDDVVMAGMLAISNAMQSAMAEAAEKMLEQALDDKIKGDDLALYAEAMESETDDDGFFDGDDTDEEDPIIELED